MIKLFVKILNDNFQVKFQQFSVIFSSRDRQPYSYALDCILTNFFGRIFIFSSFDVSWIAEYTPFFVLCTPNMICRLRNSVPPFVSKVVAFKIYAPKSIRPKILSPEWYHSKILPEAISLRTLLSKWCHSKFFWLKTNYFRLLVEISKTILECLSKFSQNLWEVFKAL